MTKSTARRLAWAVVALVLAVGVTAFGFALQRRQIELTIQNQSVRPILDPGRNAAITVCLPVVAVGNLIGDPSFGVFLGLSALNVLVWAALIYAVGRWLISQVVHEQAA